MSYISTMAVSGGIVISGDRQSVQWRECKNNTFYPRLISKTKTKLYTIGDNIGISICGGNWEGEKISNYLNHFCRINTFNKPKEAAEKLYIYLCNIDKEAVYVLHIAGYDKTMQGVPVPEIYRVSNLKEEFKITSFGNNAVKFIGNNGFIHQGSTSHYIEPYKEVINKNISYDYYSFGKLFENIEAIEIDNPIENSIETIQA